MASFYLLICLHQVMVKLELNLPWKPVLAWPWGVQYSIDSESFLVTKHVESWDIDPWKVSIFSSAFRLPKENALNRQRLQGVAQIFRRPTSKMSNKK